MTSETLATNPYEAVLADLRSKRDKIDQAIAALEATLGSQSAVSAAAGAPAQDGPSVADTSDGPGAFLGMSITDATKKLLLMRRRPLSNSEIASQLRKGGMVMSSADPNNVIGSIITRRFNQVGDIVRVDRGIWGLKEWYPNRTFKTAAKSDAKNGPTESEQPSEPQDDDPLAQAARL